MADFETYQECMDQVGDKATCSGLPGDPNLQEDEESEMQASTYGSFPAPRTQEGEYGVADEESEEIVEETTGQEARTTTSTATAEPITKTRDEVREKAEDVKKDKRDKEEPNKPTPSESSEDDEEKSKAKAEGNAVAGTYGSFPAAVDPETGEYVVEDEESKEILEETMGQAAVKRQKRGVRVGTEKEVKRATEKASEVLRGEKRPKQDQDLSPSKVQNLVEEGNYEQARKLWTDMHENRIRNIQGTDERRLHKVTPVGSGYCETVNGQDPICQNKTAYCKSPLGLGTRSCWTDPAIATDNPENANTILYEWAEHGVPLNNAEQNALDRMIKQAKSRAAANQSRVAAQRILKLSEEELKEEYKELTKELGYGPPSQTFEGYLKYKEFKENPKKIQEMQKKGIIPLSITPADLEGTGSFEQYRAAVGHPGRNIDQTGGIVPQNSGPWQAPYVHHEKKGGPGVQGLQEDEVAERLAKLHGKKRRHGLSSEEVKELGRLWDQMYIYNSTGARPIENIKDKVKKETGMDVFKEELDDAVRKEHDLSVVRVGRMASGTSPSIQESADPFPTIPEEPGVKGTQDYTPISEYEGKEFGERTGEGGWFDWGSEQDDIEAEEQMLAGGTGTPETGGIMQTVQDNPLIVTGVLGGLAWWFLR